MDLFFIDDRFKQFHAGAVAVVSADQDELVVGVDGIVLEVGVKRKDGLNGLPFSGFPAGSVVGSPSSSLIRSANISAWRISSIAMSLTFAAKSP